ncbi:MAG: diaminopimelate epimerase [Phycisphaerae bacterium]
MVTDIEFAKLSGSGNDFICIDNRDGIYDALLANEPARVHFAKTLCRRGVSVGADGLIFAGDPEVRQFADVAATFVEADGSVAELCGNGTACFTKWILDRGFCKGPEVKILTEAGVIRGSRGQGEYIKACIPFPEQRLRDQELFVAGSRWTYDFAITGVPHVVTYVKDLEAIDVNKLGRAWRHHEHFQPRGVNANFVELLGEGHIALRTFEFGVEAETFACGTGSATAAYFATRRFNWPQAYSTGEKPVRVTARSGDVLNIWITAEAGTLEVTDFCLETVVRSVYSARLDPQTREKALEAVDTARAELEGSAG